MNLEKLNLWQYHLRSFKSASSTLKRKTSEILQGTFHEKVEKDVEGKAEERGTRRANGEEKGEDT